MKEELLKKIREMSLSKIEGLILLDELQTNLLIEYCASQLQLKVEATEKEYKKAGLIQIEEMVGIVKDEPAGGMCLDSCSGAKYLQEDILNFLDILRLKFSLKL